jgi:hypothetical protein
LFGAQHQFLELPDALLDLLLQAESAAAAGLAFKQFRECPLLVLEGVVAGQVLLELPPPALPPQEQRALLVGLGEGGRVLDRGRVVVFRQLIVAPFVELGPQQVGLRVVLAVEDRAVQELQARLLRALQQTEAGQRAVEVGEGGGGVAEGEVAQEAVVVADVGVGVQTDGSSAQSQRSLHLPSLKVQSS